MHIRHGARIGHHTTIGGKSVVAYDVRIGNQVKINSSVYVCTGVEIEDMCMISAGVVFTNDVFPRAMNRELRDLETADPTADTLHTTVRRGCTIGANATIGPGLVLGEFSMIGMGAVVTRNVPDRALVTGNPARIAGHVCTCGPKLVDAEDSPQAGSVLKCERCGRAYVWSGTALSPEGAE